MQIKPTEDGRLVFLVFAIVFSSLVTKAQPVTRVTGGYGHTLFLKSDGSLWAMGFDNYGQLGDGAPQEATNRPEKITVNVTAMAAGEFHSLFVTNGALWTVGNNSSGQLGNGSRSTEVTSPIMIVPSGVTAVAAGEQFSVFLKQGGSLWAMGNNASGQVGDGTTTFYVTSPEQIVPANVVAISTGLGHCLFIKSDGSLWGMGYNVYGQLGDGNFMTGSPYGTNKPEEIVSGNVTAIAAGGYHSLFLKSDGSLWAMGDNIDGQLGDGTTNSVNRPEMIVASNVVAIAAGEGQSWFLRSDGSLWGMGDEQYGELGNGVFATNIPPYGTNRPVEIAANGVTKIGTGYLHSLFIGNGGSLWGTGLNAYGELGDGISYSTFSGLNGTNRPEQILGPYNQISGWQSSRVSMQLSFIGIAGANYALDRCLNVASPVWVPQATNQGNSYGSLIFTNAIGAGTNYFWRIRSVP